MKSLFAALSASLLLATAANAAIVIYDDAYANGWAKSQWDMTETTTVTYSGSAKALSSLTPTNGATKIGVQNAGINVGANSILEFWVNSSNASATNAIGVYIDWVGSGNAANQYFQFDTRNFANRSYLLDGVPTLIANIKTDTNGATWQQVRVDLTEPIYTGWPYVSHQFNPATDSLRYLGINSGTSNLVVDNIQLVAVPEPGLFGLTVAAGACALARRRRA